ncbi:glucan biosynthesis protein [Prosthecobacter dejongeii]|uniref:Glucans biosynthesis protein n=1 Tax=Prosthecobacter dejongeii TaxID=48465 RepID=A0A7W7YLL7_9BACT|nr:glucan biosynthesis protein [Prosthecobacter dejongeii]MBB5038486.1 glucans biosynthesis protein [Prosthecobacter dejongeii]
MIASRISGSFFLSLCTAVCFTTQAADLTLTDVTDFESLQKLAAQVALKPYQAPSQQLDPFFEGLKYDGHRQIRFLEDKALYGENKELYRVQFFHPGWMFKKPVGFFNVDGVTTTPVPFDQSLFDYGNLKLPEGFKKPEGYSGFRVLAPHSLLDKRFEFMVFMGASYYRAVTTELGYGISARGVAVNTIGGKPEEFPDFTHFWFQQPKPGQKYFRVLALLNGPSIAGAYQFDVSPGKTTDMLVKATLFLRQPVEMLGIAPFSSMFWFGENSHPKPYDFRPEVHDSDGLQIEVEGGPSIWRPLDVSRDLRLSVFEMDKLKGFGLGERDRDFNNFQDLEAMYHRRPAVWVEPIKGFNKGAVVLVELSTGEETWDNIVAMWRPSELPKTPTEPLNFEYRLAWLEEQLPGLLCKVTNTRRGFVMKTDDHEYVVDFTKGGVKLDKPADWVPELDVVVSNGEAKVLDKRVMFNRETGGWRAFFKLDVPDTTNLLEMMCEMKDGEKVISERWMYQWRR